MTTETDEDLFASIETADVDPPAEPTPEEVAAKEFEIGLAQSLGDTTGEISDDKQEEAKALIAGMSEEELKAVVEKARRVDELDERLTKMHDKAFGTIGQLKQTIDELRSRPVGGVRPNISKETFRKLAEYFDDESVAEALANDFAGVQFDSGAELPDFDAKMSQVERKFEVRLLDFAHPDWRENYNSPEFSEWRETLKPEAQEVLDNSWDGAMMAKAFSDFKAWKAKRSNAEQEKQQRIENAIQPGSSGRAASLAADDAFNQGFRKVVGQRRQR